MEKERIVNVFQVLSGNTGAATLPDDLEKIGCYTVNVGEALIRVAPHLPMEGNKLKPKIRDIINFTNELVWTSQEVFFRCSGGKELVIPRPGGIFNFIPAALAFAGVKWWDKRPAA